MFGAHMVFAQRVAGLDRLGVPRLKALVGSGVFYGVAGSEARAMAGRDGAERLEARTVRDRRDGAGRPRVPASVGQRAAG